VFGLKGRFRLFGGILAADHFRGNNGAIRATGRRPAIQRRRQGIGIFLFSDSLTAQTEAEKEWRGHGGHFFGEFPANVHFASSWRQVCRN